MHISHTTSSKLCDRGGARDDGRGGGGGEGDDAAVARIADEALRAELLQGQGWDQMLVHVDVDESGSGNERAAVRHACLDGARVLV
eukprot:g5356.t1